MKFIAAVVALASMAAAYPSLEARGDSCQPGTYDCTDDNIGWVVCDISGDWVCAGICPPKTKCVFDEQNQSPYCVPPGFEFP